MINIRILGSGGAFDDFPTSYLIEDKILIDCGNEIVKEYSNFYKESILDNIDTIFFTHSHNDHIGGIESFLYYRLVKNKMENLDVTIYGNEDCYDFFTNTAIYKEFERKNRKDFVKFIVIPMNGGSNISIESVNLGVYAFKTSHMDGFIKSNGFVFTEDNKNSNEDLHRIIITGDIDKPIELIDKDMIYKNNCIVFHDMGWTGLPNVEKTPFHKAHPTEDEVYEKYGDIPNIIGVHTKNKLKYYQKAEKDNIYDTNIFIS